jgi:DNA-binding transcriptional MerR regulator
VINGLLQIGEAARMLGVCEGTLRRWERKGRLRPTGRFGQNRVYLVQDVERLKRKARPLSAKTSAAEPKEEAPTGSPIRV